MASKKISELALASPLAGGEKLAAVQGGANVAVTPAQIVALSGVAGKADMSRTIATGEGLTGGGDLSADRTIALSGDTIATLAQVGAHASAIADNADAIAALEAGAGNSASAADTRPPRIAFAGDSIGLLFGAMNPPSPWYWSLAQVPRVWSYETDGGGASGNVSSSGKKSGELWSGIGRTGSKVYTAVADDFATGQLARLLAYKPDILFLEIGTNDTAAPTAAMDATFLNVRDAYEALRANGLKHLVVCSILPRANLSVSCNAYNQSIRQWARTTPGVHVLDLSAYMVDDASATGDPLGGTAGAAGAMSHDGLHPSAVFGRAAADAVTACLDDLGIARTLPRGVGQKEIYNASTAPGGNLLGTKGSFVGTAGTLLSGGGGASGSIASGWLVNTSDAELTAAFSKDTLVDARGQSHVAQLVTFGTTGAPLAAARQMKMIAPLTGVPAGRRLASQILAQFADLVGCVFIRLSLDAAAGVVFSASFGDGSGVYPPCQDFPTSATAMNLDLVNPWSALPDPSNTALNLTVLVGFRAGTTPAGTLRLAQAGAWAEVDLP